MERKQKAEENKEEDYSGFTCGPMMATLDLFFFRFVLQSIEVGEALYFDFGGVDVKSEFRIASDRLSLSNMYL